MPAIPAPLPADPAPAAPFLSAELLSAVLACCDAPTLGSARLSSHLLRQLASPLVRTLRSTDGHLPQQAWREFTGALHLAVRESWNYRQDARTLNGVVQVGLCAAAQPPAADRHLLLAPCSPHHTLIRCAAGAAAAAAGERGGDPGAARPWLQP